MNNSTKFFFSIFRTGN
ncbi:TPA: peptide IlvX [Shigella boydii]|nr:peptide IlvX [Shigella boydii]EFS3867560.1 hypothetical protein [Shigella boydii]WNT66462.1 peptide IlvX [Shigella boydii]HCS1415737.1 hypothetical protein [Shigella boydii]